MDGGGRSPAGLLPAGLRAACVSGLRGDGCWRFVNGRQEKRKEVRSEIKKTMRKVNGKLLTQLFVFRVV